jgi:Cu2+-exporting ATPase
VRVDLAIALAYNALAVGLALAGKMSPLLCAVLMPASSLTTIGATVAALSSRRLAWRS